MTDEMISQEEIDSLMSQAGGGDSGDQQAADAGQTQAEAPSPAISFASQPSQAQPAQFAPVSQHSGGYGGGSIDMIMDVQLNVAVELGRASLKVKDVLGLGPGAVVELDKHAGEPVEVVINNKVVARGEVVVIDENFGVRITEIVGANEKSAQAKAA